MVAGLSETEHEHYAAYIDVSKKVRWGADNVILGRKLDAGQKFLPDGLSLVHELEFLSADEQRFLSQVQARTYAYVFGLVERFINAKVLDTSRQLWLGDRTALEALVQFSDEETKYQDLFRRIESLAVDVMPEGHEKTTDANAVASVVAGKSIWAVLALTCHIGILTHIHYEKSIESAADLSPLWKDVLRFHWEEECQHAILDELEWRREDMKLGGGERNQAVSDLIDLIVEIDRILQVQATADAGYFLRVIDRELSIQAQTAVGDRILKAYRWQYIVSGIQDDRFMAILKDLIDDRQAERVSRALGPML